ncbi:angiopoietin-related protein 4-like [Coregonus clupeaformis]|uniref:angiopoietin-related protein 4-like n=1 Tax=Coregonus clupeaformis TaxID=59861 RepID=UPI001BE0ECFF|nr:angiopoietin-related protein 4-like [Coregonus clupeaformis]
MKPTLAFLLLLASVLVHMGSSFSFGREGAQYASWDDMNVVAHGLLQLGQGLKEHVEKTKRQMRDISTKLKAFNGTVADLSRQNKSLQEGEEALKTRAQEMVERESQVVNMSAEVHASAEELRAERQRMDRLEERVDGMQQGRGLKLNNSSNNRSDDANFIQRLLEAQNKWIDDLVDRIRQQQDELEKQNMHLQALQGKVKQRRVKSVVRRKHQEIALKDYTEEVASLTELATDCHELFLKGERNNGVYAIQPRNSQPFDVFCEMTAEGGWTVIQRRQDGSQNFNQLWEAYQKGFGSLKGEFWLGLDNIHTLTKQEELTLLVELSDWRGEAQSVQYTFRLGGEESNYALYLPKTICDSLENGLTTGPSGLSFSTIDRDNDLNADVNCAKQLSGGWWFSNCGQSNLNGKYPRKPNIRQRRQPRKQLIFWKTNHALRTTVLKIAPATVKSSVDQGYY